MKAQVTLPLPPNRANARQHWAATYREKSNYLEACLPGLYRVFRPLNGPKFKRKVRVDALFYVWSEFDEDNLRALLKFPLDALRHYRVIAGDDPSLLTVGEIRQVVDRRNRRLELTLTEVGPVKP